MCTTLSPTLCWSPPTRRASTAHCKSSSRTRASLCAWATTLLVSGQLVACATQLKQPATASVTASTAAALTTIIPCSILCLHRWLVLLSAGYGQESHSRVQRQQIPHQIYKDNNGVEHVRVSSWLLLGFAAADECIQMPAGCGKKGGHCSCCMRLAGFAAQPTGGAPLLYVLCLTRVLMAPVCCHCRHC